MKLFYFDLETTGVKHWKNGIHQISGVIEIDGEVKEHFNFKVQPNPKCEIEKEALEVGKVTQEQIMAYPAMNIVYKELIIILQKYVDRFSKKDKFFLIGYNNAGFDNNFFRAFFLQNNDNYFGSYFWAGGMDVMVLATEFLKHKRHLMQDFKLKTVAEEMGLSIDASKLHDAVYDVFLTRAIYKSIIDRSVINDLW